MNFFETMLERNARFAEREFAPDLKMMPSTGTIVVGCVDPRVDPVEVLGLKQGEVAVICNVGGRVNKPLMETLGLLRAVAKAAGRNEGARKLVLLHHTDCGIIGCLHQAPDLLAQHMGVETVALVSVREQLESPESLVIPFCGTRFAGGDRCGRPRTVVGMTEASCATRAI